MADGFTLRWRIAPRPRLRFRVGMSMAFALPEGDQPSPVAVVIGPRGRDGTAAGKFIFNQPSAALQWIVNHNLGEFPSAVCIKTPGGLEVNAQVLHASVNQSIITFSVPFAGVAIIS